MRKKVIIHLYLIGGFFSICSAIYFGYYYFFYLPAIAQSPDAIAVRVYQNQDHQSALAWYQAKGFAGSPQALSVDGYDAIRDGRTVYVHAANIDLGSDPIIQTDDIYYSNIYLISYNQQAEADTNDIFGQLLKNWRFNTNLTDSGACALSTRRCQSDKTCPANEKCDQGFCQLKESANCLADDECPSGLLCTSPKAQITRDTKRLARLQDFHRALAKYKDKNDKYPNLAAGSYLPHASLSAWPSWQETLAPTLGLVAMPIDPVNQLGPCDTSDPKIKYDPLTCWDERAKKFDGTLVYDPNQLFDLPVQSQVLAYVSDEQGQNYQACAFIESSYPVMKPFACAQQNVTNQAPIILDNYSLSGQPKSAFSGSIKGQDPDNLTTNAVSWSIEYVNPDNWTAGWGSDQAKWPKLVINTETSYPTSVINVQAPQSGKVGTYILKVKIKDKSGTETTKELPITISPLPLTLESANKTFTIGHSGEVTMAGTDENGDLITKIDAITAAIYDNNQDVLANLANHGFSLVANQPQIKYEYKSEQKTGTYSLTVQIKSRANPEITKEAPVNFTVENHAPIIDNVTATFQNNSTCVLGATACPDHFVLDNSENASLKIDAHDPDSGHVLAYEISEVKTTDTEAQNQYDGYTTNEKLIINPTTGKITNLANLAKNITREVKFSVTVFIKDNYYNNSKPEESSATKEIILKIQPYCGPLVPSSFSTFNKPNEFLKVTPPSVTKAQIALNFSSCSQVYDGEMTMNLKGKSESKNLIFVLDFSGSMEKIPPGQSQKAIDLLKSAMTGVLDDLNAKAKSIAPSNQIVNVAVVAFSNDASAFYNYYSWFDWASYSPNMLSENPGMVYYYNIMDDIKKNGMENLLNNKNEGGGTNILDALNIAELIASQKIGITHVILMSDGMPYEYKLTNIQYDCITPYCNATCSAGSPGCGGPGTPPPGGGVFYHPETPEEDFVFTSALLDHTFNNPSCETPTQNYVSEIKDSDFCNEVVRNKDLLCPQPEKGLDACTCAQTAGPDCPTNLSCITWSPYAGWIESNYYDPYCLVTNVGEQADILKQKNYFLETIFYLTDTTNNNSQKMCEWSSECPLGMPAAACTAKCQSLIADNYAGSQHAVGSSDVQTMFQDVIKKIFNKPTELKFNTTQIVQDKNPSSLDSTQKVCVNNAGDPNCADTNIALSCADNRLELLVSDGEGEVSLKDLSVKYCPSKVHP